MKERRLVVSVAGFSDADEEALRVELGTLFPRVHTSRVLQLSIDPPRWVDMVAHVLTWELVLKVAATAYLAQLAKHMADSTWEGRKRVRSAVIAACGGALLPLRKLIAIVQRPKGRGDRTLSVGIHIWGPSDARTGIVVDVEDHEEFIEAVSLFVGRLQGIATAVETLKEQGNSVLQHVGCEFTETGFQLLWVQHPENRPYHQDFDIHERPLTAPRRRKTEEK